VGGQCRPRRAHRDTLSAPPSWAKPGAAGPGRRHPGRAGDRPPGPSRAGPAAALLGQAGPTAPEPGRRPPSWAKLGAADERGEWGLFRGDKKGPNHAFSGRIKRPQSRILRGAGMLRWHGGTEASDGGPGRCLCRHERRGLRVKPLSVKGARGVCAWGGGTATWDYCGRGWIGLSGHMRQASSECEKLGMVRMAFDNRHISTLYMKTQAARQGCIEGISSDRQDSRSLERITFHCTSSRGYRENLGKYERLGNDCPDTELIFIGNNVITIFLR
jgi:hypothetical protein